MQSQLDRRALFADETTQFRYPESVNKGDLVTFRFRTGTGNADAVYLISNRMEIKMKKAVSQGMFDYYEASLKMDAEPLSYYFEVRKGKENCFYNKLGCTNDLQEAYEFRVIPGFNTPEWAKGAVFYQIFVDRFCNGSPENDPKDREYSYIGEPIIKVDNWEQTPQAMDVRCFYGGDLQGVRQKLDYLQYLGVEVIYFNPLFVSPSNHKYDIQDYDYIDPHFAVIDQDDEEVLPENCNDNRESKAYIKRVIQKDNLEASNAFFAQLVEEIHARGMRVILDGVFNHCGSFNKWMDRDQVYEGVAGYEPGAFVAKDSPYHDFFHFSDPNGWPYNKSYSGWWGYDTLPKLYYEQSPQLEEYIMAIGRKWISAPYNADGWRLDVAADLGMSQEYNHRFWKKFRENVKETKNDALILAEHYGDPYSWLRGDQWDSVMNYDAFLEPIGWFLTGMEKHSDEFDPYLYGNGDWFIKTMAYNMSKFSRPSLDVAMNELSNHDHVRFLTKTNQQVGRIGTRGAEAASRGIKPGVFREAVVMQFTWPGAPTVYYGDEAGVVGWTDPDNRRTYPWGKENWEFIEFHREMIRIHKQYSCLKKGSYKDLIAEPHFLVYGRFDGENEAVIVVNNARGPRTIEIPIWELGAPFYGIVKRVMQTTESTYNIGEVTEKIYHGTIQVTVPGVSATVYISSRGGEL